MKKTALYDWHLSHGAKMAPFAGFDMPISYAGLIAEHKAVREQCGLFDVSHMGEIYLEGPGAENFIQKLTCNDIKNCGNGKAQYSMFLNHQGGVIDDIIIYRFHAEKFLIVVNASNVEKDFAWLESQHSESEACQLINRSGEFSLIALQGPQSSVLLKKLGFNLERLARFSFEQLEISGVSMLIARTGYTGELGSELMLRNDDAPKIWDLLIQTGKEFGIQPVGLGARDTLRLEKAYALYGHELTDEITPLEANLNWVVKLNSDDFIGKEALLAQSKRGVNRRLIGLKMKDRSIARENYDVYLNSKKVGWIASGTRSPSLEQSIATAFVEVLDIKSGDELGVEIRGAIKQAQVCDLPFL